MTYRIHRAAARPVLHGDWDGAGWRAAETGALTHVVPRSSDHHPLTHFRALYDDDALYVIFRVEDRYVRSVETAFNASVCKDSCVECFVEPRPGAGYLNFEINCGGTLLCYFIEDATIIPGQGFAKCRPLTPAQGAQVEIFHSLPAVVEPEISAPTVWVNEFRIPFALFEACVGPLGAPAGQVWRANFYKCADATSHPHWLTWAPIAGTSFHQPQYFAPILFAA